MRQDLLNMTLKSAHRPFADLSDKVDVEPSREVSMTELDQGGGNIINNLLGGFNRSTGILTTLSGAIPGSFQSNTSLGRTLFMPYRTTGLLTYTDPNN
jgi:hypothetical protein